MARLSLRIAHLNEVQRTELPLVEIVDRLLDRGVVVAGGATIAVADVELIDLRLNVVLAAADTLARAVAPRAGMHMVVTLRWKTPRVSDTTSGAAFLRARASDRREAERLVERLAAELGIERALIRERISPQPGVAATVAITIQAGEEMNVRRSVERFGEHANEVTTDLSAPIAS